MNEHETRAKIHGGWQAVAFLAILAATFVSTLAILL